MKVILALMLVAWCATANAKTFTFRTSPDTFNCDGSQACYYAKTVYMRFLEKGWHTVEYKPIALSASPCKRSVVCFKDGVIYSSIERSNSKWEYQLGYALEQATGIDVPRNAESILGHEFLHAVGFKH